MAEGIQNQMDRIAENWEIYEETATYAAETFGVDIVNIELGGQSLAEWVRDAGLLVATISVVAEGVGTAAAAVAAHLGASVSVPVVGWVIAGVIVTVVGSLRIARAVNCGRDARRDRDRLTDALNDVTALVFADAPEHHVEEYRRRLNFRLREALVFVSGAFDIPESRGRLRWGGWNDKRPPEGMRWTDGSTGSRSGADSKYRNQPCKKKAAFRGMRTAAESLLESLEEQPDPRDRAQIVLTLLGVYLGHEGNPYIGLVDAFIHAGAPFQADAVIQTGFGSQPPLDAREITHIGVMSLTDPELH